MDPTPSSDRYGQVLQKIEVSRWRKLQVGEAAVIDTGRLKIPKADVGQLVSNDLLKFGVRGLALLDVRFLSCRLNEHVNPRILISSPVISLRRRFAGMEHPFEEVRVVVATNPAQRKHLEVSADNIAIE